MKSSLLALCALALTTTAVQAAKPDSLDHQLTVDRGMIKVADGLYARINNDRESYVVTNANGQHALSLRLTQIHDLLKSRFAKKGFDPAHAKLLERLQTSAEQWAERATRKDYQTGGCGNGSSTAAYAATNDGIDAVASAVNALDFSPPTPTTNEALAYNDYQYSQDTKTGLDQATAQVSHPASCFAYAEATVTCPGGGLASAPAVSASWNWAPRCNF